MAKNGVLWGNDGVFCEDFIDILKKSVIIQVIVLLKIEKD